MVGEREYAYQRKTTIFVGNALLHTFFFLLSLCFLAPFLLVVSIAFTDENALNAHGYQFLPSKFSVYAFHVLFKVRARFFTLTASRFSSPSSARYSACC